MNYPLCEHPQAIVNRNYFSSAVLRGYVHDGKTSRKLSLIEKRNWMVEPPYKQYTKILYTSIYNKDKSINYARLASYYTLDEFGNKVYAFLLVACGHCSICLERHRTDFQTRVTMESAVSRTACMMVTLTYDEQHLPLERLWNCTREHPFDSDEVYIAGVPIKQIQYFVSEWRFYKYGSSNECCDNVRSTLYTRDIQLFLKRLRKRWSDYSIVPDSYKDQHKDITDKKLLHSMYLAEYPFRYCVVGEYGKKFGRPHYHCLFWNVPYDIFNNEDVKSVIDISRFRLDVLKAWGKCQPQSMQCEIARDAGKYVGKYLSKENPNGRKGICLASNRGGGIGSKVIDANAEYLRNNPSVNKLHFRSFNHEYCEFTLGQYASRRIFPTYSRMTTKYTQSIRNINNITAQVARKYESIGLPCKWEINEFRKSCIGHTTKQPKYLPSYPLSDSELAEQYKNFRKTHGGSYTIPYEDFLYSYILDLESMLFSALSERVQLSPDGFVEMWNFSDQDLQSQLAANNAHAKSLTKFIVQPENVYQAKVKALEYESHLDIIAKF